MSTPESPTFFTGDLDPTATLAQVFDPRPAEAAPPEQFPHAMVDIETMDNHTSRALILSVAAIPFALGPDGPRFGSTFLILPELSEQLATGRRVTRGTQDFWAKAGPKARRHWNGPHDRTPAWDVGFELAAFLRANTAGRSAQIWFRGQGFDVGNLDNLIDEHDTPSPWSAFWMLRDQRTATTFFPRQRTRPQELVIEGDPHDPIHDCRQQIWTLWEHAPVEALGLEPNPVRPPVEGLHPLTQQLVDDFAHALALKLRAAETKYGHLAEWAEPNWRAECQRQLVQHVAKGDPLDVAAYAAFCWRHGWPTAADAPASEGEAR